MFLSLLFKAPAPIDPIAEEKTIRCPPVLSKICLHARIAAPEQVCIGRFFL
jgi:hypothetical protein